MQLYDRIDTIHSQFKIKYYLYLIKINNYKLKKTGI